MTTPHDEPSDAQDRRADRRIPPSRRKHDPPPTVARWNAVLAPWHNVIEAVIAICTVLGLLGGLLLFFGVRITGPSDDAAAIKAQIEAVRVEQMRERAERLAADSISMRDRYELRMSQEENKQINKEIRFTLCSLMSPARAQENYACQRARREERDRPILFSDPQAGRAVPLGSRSPALPSAPPPDDAPLVVALPAGKRWPWPLMPPDRSPITET